MALLLRKLGYCVNLVLVALVFGAFFGTWLALSPAKGMLSAAAYTEVQQATIRTYGAQMPVVMALSIASSVVVLVLLWRRRSAARWLSLVSLLCLVGILLLTLAGELPLNRQMLTWSSAAPPANWASLRDRWELYHSVRAALSVVALSCQLLAVVPAAAPAAVLARSVTAGEHRGGD